MNYKRFKTWQDVPIVSYATVSYSHPDLGIILYAYKKAGAGIAIYTREELDMIQKYVQERK